MLQVGILAHKREGMQAFSCASGAGCALTRDHESRRGRKSPGGDWREAPFRPCEQARGRKGDSAPTLRVFPARRTRNPACGGTRKRPLRGLHEKDGPAPFQHKECGGGRYRAARSFGSIPPTSVSCRPKAVSCPSEAGLSCPASDGAQRVAEGRGGEGRCSLTAAASPNANRRSRSIAPPVFVVARSAPTRGGLCLSAPLR